MQFKLDENLPEEVAVKLRQAGHDALTVADQQMVGAVDPTLMSVCRAEQRTLVTLDFDFADIRIFPPKDACGIVVIRPRRQSKTAILGLVEQLLRLLEVETVRGKLWILEEHGLRIREG